MDGLSGTRDRSVGAYEEIGIDNAKLAVGPEPDLAAVDADADDEAVVVTEHLVVAEALQRCACRQRLGAGAVDRAPGRRGSAAFGGSDYRIAHMAEFILHQLVYPSF
jgi:hypothetical protein